jgi:hypothetical protein
MSAPCISPPAAISPTLLASFDVRGTVCEHEHWHGHRRQAEHGESLSPRHPFSHCCSPFLLLTDLPQPASDTLEEYGNGFLTIFRVATGLTLTWIKPAHVRLGQKQTFAEQKRQVRFTPKADLPYLVHRHRTPPAVCHELRALS